jgi:hypothetical protein
LALGQLDDLVQPPGRRQIEGGLPVARHEGIHVDQRSDALWNAIGNAGDNEPAVAVADEDRVLHLLPAEYVHNIGDVRLQAHSTMQQVRALGGPGEAWCVHGMAQGAKALGDPTPFPSAVPGGVDQDEFGHRGEDGKQRFP